VARKGSLPGDFRGDARGHGTGWCSTKKTAWPPSFMGR
jgi:hypothetical protein